MFFSFKTVRIVKLGKKQKQTTKKTQHLYSFTGYLEQKGAVLTEFRSAPSVRYWCCFFFLKVLLFYLCEACLHLMVTIILLFFKFLFSFTWKADAHTEKDRETKNFPSTGEVPKCHVNWLGLGRETRSWQLIPQQVAESHNCALSAASQGVQGAGIRSGGGTQTQTQHHGMQVSHTVILTAVPSVHPTGVPLC